LPPPLDCLPTDGYRSVANQALRNTGLRNLFGMGASIVSASLHGFRVTVGTLHIGRGAVGALVSARGRAVALAARLVFVAVVVPLDGGW
jgi:hypothetical protein